MKARVIENICIGCGACQAIAPDEFEINDSGFSEALNDAVESENEEAVKEASDNCPTNAIIIEEE